MGSCLSKNGAPESNDVSAINRKPKGTLHARNVSPNPPQTRTRIDSWANAPATFPESMTHPPNQNSYQNLSPHSQGAVHSMSLTPPKATLRTKLETQWKYLWETHSPHLVDPVDVPSVLDMLIDKTINRLSAVQITWLQRKVRMAFSSLPNSNSGGGSKAVLAKIVSNGQTLSDAKVLAERMRVLHPSIWQRVIPVAAWCPSYQASKVPTTAPRQNSISSFSSTNAQNLPGLDGPYDSDSLVWSDLVLRNLEQILLHLSSSDWERVSLAASHAAEAAGIEIDVNRRDNGWSMPRPSAVPEITDPASLPPGVTLQALAAIIAMAVAGTRAQRLHLLFYLLLPDLQEFLALHPAGGAPVWLLEAGNSTVISLASLTHYHYYGTAFLPVPSTSKALKRKHNFVASKSREPLKVKVKDLHSLLQDIVQNPAENSAPIVQEQSSPDHESMFPPKLQDRLNIMTPELFTRDLQESRAKLEASIARYLVDSKANTHWTLQEFEEWLEQSVDDALLELTMHRIFAAGILPSHADEARWVAAEWGSWFQNQQTTIKQDIESAQARVIESTAEMEETNGLNVTRVSAPFDHLYSQVWGGLGGIDGGGGTGYGMLYCIDQHWWNAWSAYVGWSWRGDPPGCRTRLRRPRSLSNAGLLEGTDGDGVYISGAFGSFEMMKKGALKNKDYVLVPPGVWNVLYEMYGGGPPLPRAIRLPGGKASETYRMGDGLVENGGRNHEHRYHKKEVDRDDFVEQLSSDLIGRVPRLPESLSVASHPWVLNVQLCDPSQPYRRGDVGLTSIRVMVTPDESLWRVVSEIVTRFTLQSFKAFDHYGKGRARIWKRTDNSEAKAPASRYGPWNLLCQSRYATIPNLAIGDSSAELSDLTWFFNDWRVYTDHLTVEGSGLVDRDRLLLEFAVQNREGELIWPREAAAKAGRARRLVEEENEFRRKLQGFDDEDNPMVRPPDLIGLHVDAMDSTGRWYPVKILAVDIIDEDTTDEEAEMFSRVDYVRGSSKRVKVDFAEHGGHMDWIDVESDRLGPVGRFTNETDQQVLPKNNGTSAPNTEKSKVVVSKKSSSNISDAGGETAKLCSLPGFGACGLANLGNTCYMNSALQCISYMPLLRAYLLNDMFKATGDLNKDNPLGTGGKFLEESAELMKTMWCSRFGEKSPTRFKAHLGKFNPQFSGADQQDAQEFLNYMLDVLHEDSNRVRTKPYVEPLDDEYVRLTILNRVGEESWRRFLRRNRSVVSDVAMGQVLNTVTCPVCSYSSRNFDPFNLLSIPIPTVADVIFQCTLYRRATPLNCPWVLNRSRRGASQSTRYSLKAGINTIDGPPSELYVAEQYAVTMSRLADSGDLRLQLQNISGIAAARLHLFRSEEVENDGFEAESVLSHRVILTPLNDKEGPCSQLVKKSGQNEFSAASITQIVAFENSLRTRPLEEKSEILDDYCTLDESSTGDRADLLSRCLETYGDERECRICDSDPLVLAKQISRRMWPKSAKDFTIGLRVDAKDQRGNWFSGSVVEVFDDVADGGDTDTGKEVQIETRKVSVHFDNFSPKWDETYSIGDFEEEKVQPLFSHATPKTKPTELLVHHRYDNSTVYFGLPIYVYCRNEWSNARAGAQILAQASSFLYFPPVDPVERKGSREAADPSVDRALRESRNYDKTQRMVSDLVDLLLDYDREYVHIGLGVTIDHEIEGTLSQEHISSSLKQLSRRLALKVSEFLTHLPFEIRVSSVDPVNADKTHTAPQEEPFHFSLERTIGNFVTARSVIILNWRLQSRDTGGSSASSIGRHVMYLPPPIQCHKASAEILKVASANDRDSEKRKSQVGSGGVGLGACLKEFCKEQKLSLSDNWRCPRCRDFREGRQDMMLWRPPDFLTFHLKRFNMSARWREKITTKVNFPLTGLDVSEWCHESSPAIQRNTPDSCIYDLIGVVNHYGSMTGGHYVATCKVSNCRKDGKEEVAYTFNGVGVMSIQSDEMDTPSGWRLGRSKADLNQIKVAATVSAKAVAESAEPHWLQFDDELVEPIPPDAVVTEMAYVLFYRRRELSSSNIARYSTID